MPQMYRLSRAGHNAPVAYGADLRHDPVTMPAPTDTELSHAVQTMFRVRAVESPPDETGTRTIWHRGAKGADLVTWVDTIGKVTRQELYLFNDCFVWEKEPGLKTGEHRDVLGSKLAPAPGTIAYDPELSPERLQRARTGFVTYRGDDKCLLNMRYLLTEGLRGVDLDLEPVTGRAAAKPEDRPADASAASPRPRRGPWLWLALGLAGAALAALGAWLLLK